MKVFRCPSCKSPLAIVVFCDESSCIVLLPPPSIHGGTITMKQPTENEVAKLFNFKCPKCGKSLVR